MSGLSPIPTDPHIVEIQGERAGYLTPLYQSWLQSLQYWLSPVGTSGPTAKRPTKQLYVGQVFYDTTLGYPVWVHQVSPSIIWHNGAGAAV
jgi:hypothetical protein